MIRQDVGAGWIRRFNLPLTTVTNAQAAIDFCEVLVPTGWYYELRRLVISQKSEVADAQAEMFHVELKRATSGYTSGSGGTTSTFRPRRTTDAATAQTAEVFNTTQAVAGTGTLITLEEESFFIARPYLHQPDPDGRLGFYAGEAFIASLETAVADDTDFLGYAEFECVQLGLGSSP